MDKELTWEFIFWGWLFKSWLSAASFNSVASHLLLKFISMTGKPQDLLRPDFIFQLLMANFYY
jgi:hypothetical protein